jgi:hypothetical protein
MREFNNSFSVCYPPEDKMKVRTNKANLCAYMLGGYDVIDYSYAINNLHKKLLKKIVLNR